MKKLLLFMLPLLFASCVAKQKYQDAVESKDYLEAEILSMKQIKSENRLLAKDLARLEVQFRQAAKNSEDSNNRIYSLEAGNAELLNRYNGLLERNKTLLGNSSTEIRALSEQLASREYEVFQRTRRLDSLEQALQNQSSSSDGWNAKINELQTALQQKDAKVNDLRQKINQALASFSAADLSVVPRDGKLYVSLSQNLLFKTGSDKIDPKGALALQQLGAILRNNPDLQIAVEGHTDNQGKPEYNWKLSTLRANSVVKILTGNGVNPRNVTSSGRAMYHPLVPNDTEAHRARNRRVEIILTPKLDELYQIMKG